MKVWQTFVDFRKLTSLFALGGMLATSALGLAQDTTIDYSQGQRAFPTVLAPYKAQEVPPPSFVNAPRITSLIRDGRLYLSLDDAIALALENNLDLAIARYNLNIADTDILRAKSGQSIRGVGTGLVQGTPGGGVGTFGTNGTNGTGATGATGAGVGGTTGGAGGAGSGSSGLVQSTLGAGAPVEQLDPNLSGTVQYESATFPLSNTRTTGVNNLRQNTFTADFNYNQGFATGTSMQVGFNNSRQTTNATFSSLSPVLNSNFRATVVQRLLNGAGRQSNLRFIRIARNNRKISDSAFRQQVISTVSQIQNIYWDLVTAYDDVQVKQRSLALAQKTISDNTKQVEIGTLAPIEIVRANSESATRNQELIVSQTNLQLQQTLMKNAVSRSLADPTVTSAVVIPTDTMSIPPVEPAVPVEDLIKQAQSQRPELEQSQIDLTNREITKKAARNGLLPVLDAFAFYGGSGLAGQQNPLSPCSGATCAVGSGFGTALQNSFNNSFPDKAVGLNLNIPLRNRAAQADQVRSELEYRQSQLRLKQQENTINIEVRNAQFSLEQNRALVEAARKAQELGTQSLDAEQKKYALGASTNFLVLQSQRDLAISESSVVRAMSAYEKARVELDRVTGQTLVRNGIQLPDAETGNVSKLPAVPYVTPRPAGEIESRPAPQYNPPPASNPPPPSGSPENPQPPSTPQAADTPLSLKNWPHVLPTSAVVRYQPGGGMDKSFQETRPGSEGISTEVMSASHTDRIQFLGLMELLQ